MSSSQNLDQTALDSMNGLLGTAIRRASAAIPDSHASLVRDPMTLLEIIDPYLVNLLAEFCDKNPGEVRDCFETYYGSAT